MLKSSNAPYGPATLRRRTPIPVRIAVLLAVLLSAGCSDRPRIASIENQPPDVALDPASEPLVGESGAIHAVSWSGRDTDGRIDHYLVAHNPASLDAGGPAWRRTDRRAISILATRRTGIGAAQRVDPGDAAGGSYDLIAVIAVDDRGAHSVPAVRAWFGDNIAPEARIVDPLPRALVAPTVPPSITVHFEGADADVPHGRPARFKYILLGPDSEFPVQVALVNPDSVRRFYAPEFRGWESVPGVKTSATLEGLQPGATYVFVITALDAHGAYDPVFSLDRNMLRMRVAPEEAGGPSLNLGGLGPGVATPVFIEVPAGTPLVWSWTATPQPGTSICGYRALLDGVPLEGGRADCKRTCDRRCWNPEFTQISLGPFAGGERHAFTVEVSDDLGRIARQSLDILAVATSFDRPLLIVDDTRLAPDMRTAGSSCTAPPVGPWPTAAELDTFLFARGGYPWRCYGPSGTMSPPGLFSGYPFDTIGTRTGSDNAAVPLATLARYRHVVWLVDALGASGVAPPSDPLMPITSLRYMSNPGRYNTLAAYSSAGGRVWLAGAGGARASLSPWNVTSNDVQGTVWSGAAGELIPGRMIYDLAGWRSEITSMTAAGFFNRVDGATIQLPAQLRAKSPALDPLPPGRSGQPSTHYYQSTYPVEFLSAPNHVIENGTSVLDSLYEFVTFSLPPAPGVRRITMTAYRGTANGGFVMSGFDPWRFTRADAQTLVHYVLQDEWGLMRTTPAGPVVRAEPRKP